MLDFLMEMMMACTTGRIYEDGSLPGGRCFMISWGCTP